MPRRREGAAAEGLVEEHFWTPGLEGLVFHGRGSISDAAWAGVSGTSGGAFEMVLSVRLALGGAFAALVSRQSLLASEHISTCVA